MRTGGTEASPVSTDPLFIGQFLADDGPTAYLAVEFDHDSDGDVDGTTTTTFSGDFLYLPSGLATGNRTISARALNGTMRRKAWLTGPWKLLPFQLIAQTNIAPVVQELVPLQRSAAPRRRTVKWSTPCWWAGVWTTFRPQLPSNLTMTTTATSTALRSAMPKETSATVRNAQPGPRRHAGPRGGVERVTDNERRWRMDHAQLPIPVAVRCASRLVEQPPIPGNPLPDADPTRRSLRGRVTSEGAGPGRDSRVRLQYRRHGGPVRHHRRRRTLLASATRSGQQATSTSQVRGWRNRSSYPRYSASFFVLIRNFRTMRRSCWNRGSYLPRPHQRHRAGRRGRLDDRSARARRA